MSVLYFSFPSRRVNSSLAAESDKGLVYKSHAVAAKTLAAKFIPCRAMDVPPLATACHECPGTPGTKHAVEKPVVGTTQDTSPTSVEPMLAPPPVRKST